ncbi:MAG: BlaI/MecI/CopY family transcriptional regulator [bacterium]|nr:BlaI/MecI/CopY family transcriptional regulator [bacterium]
MVDPEIRSLAPSELAVMKVLWRCGALSAREVHDVVADELGWAYSTTRTTIERMVGKGIVSKKPFHGLHIYEPAISRAFGLAGTVRDFARHVMDSNHVAVVSLLAEREVLSEEEIEELRALLDGAGVGK